MRKKKKNEEQEEEENLSNLADDLYNLGKENKVKKIIMIHQKKILSILIKIKKKIKKKKK
jgi:hypothetical protein